VKWTLITLGIVLLSWGCRETIERTLIKTFYTIRGAHHNDTYIRALAPLPVSS